MPKLPVISGKEAVRAFKKIGFLQISQRGSHIKLRRVLPNKTETLTIPDHKELRKGTLRSGILKPLDMTPEEFIKLLKL